MNSIGHDWAGRLIAIVASAEFDELQNCAQLPEHPDITFRDVSEAIDAFEGGRLTGGE